MFSPSPFSAIFTSCVEENIEQRHEVLNSTFLQTDICIMLHFTTASSKQDNGQVLQLYVYACEPTLNMTAKFQGETVKQLEKKPK